MGVVPYVLRAQNLTTGNLLGVVLSDRPPAGFKIVEDSAMLVQPGLDLEFGTPDDVVTPILPTSIRPLEFGPFDLASGEAIEVRYTLRVGSGALLGDATNRAVAVLGGAPVSATARASVEVIADPILDQSTIIGKVFQDPNRNGFQDPGESGIARAMVVLDNGTYALTDEHGRYHFPAIEPGHRMLKINLHSLPPGTDASTEDSHITWITPGLTARVNFGVVVPQNVETIGRPQELGLAVAGDTEHQPLELLGKAEELSLLVNDRRIPLDSTDVRLRLQNVDRIVVFTGDIPTDPLEFELSVETADTVSGWRLTVLDAAEQPVRTFTGEGHPPELLRWDGRTDHGEPVTAGDVYLYQLEIRHPDGGWSASIRRLFGVNRNTVVALELTGNAFEVGASTLSENAKQMLEEATAILNDYPDERILVEGHTDSLGTDAFNLSLSQSRARAAAAYLTEELGFPEKRIVAQWYGESRPVAPNALDDGREMNRRVEVKAEVEEVESTEITDRYRSQPEVRINGTAVELGRHGRFSAVVEPGTTTALDVEMSNSHGRSVRTTVDIPRLDIYSPSGAATVSEIRQADGCRIEEQRVVCRLEALTDHGNTVVLDGQALTPGLDGRISVDLPLEMGANVFGIIARNDAGISRSANLAVTVRDRDAQGNVLVLTEAIPNLTVNLPTQGARLSESNLAISGHTDPGNHVWANDRQLEVGPDGRFDTVVELPTGQSRLVLRVADPQGRSGTIERDVEVAAQPAVHDGLRRRRVRQAVGRRGGRGH